MKLGDKVKVKYSTYLLNGCEGIITEIENDDGEEVIWVEIYKVNDKITKDEVNNKFICFNQEELELL